MSGCAARLDGAWDGPGSAEAGVDGAGGGFWPVGDFESAHNGLAAACARGEKPPMAGSGVRPLMQPEDSFKGVTDVVEEVFGARP